MLFNTVEGYCRNAALFQFDRSPRIQVSPITVLSLMQMRVNEACELLLVASLAPYKKKWNESLKMLSV